MPKRSDDEILSALKILEEIGERNGLAYQRLVKQLPPGKRPPASDSVSGTLLVVGTEYVWGESDTVLDRIEAAVKKAWAPVTVTVGKKKFEVRFDGLEV